MTLHSALDAGSAAEGAPVDVGPVAQREEVADGLDQPNQPEQPAQDRAEEAAERPEADAERVEGDGDGAEGGHVAVWDLGVAAA